MALPRKQAKKVAIIQARMTSTRFPGKVIIPLADEPLVVRLLQRVQCIEGLDEIAFAVPEGHDHDAIEQVLYQFPYIKVIRGSEHNVLERYLKAIEATNADIVMRITADCPLIDSKISSSVLDTFIHSEASYVSTDLKTGFPLGLDTEVFEANLLKSVAGLADDYEQEHVTPYLWRRPFEFPAIYLNHAPDYKFLRLTIDTPKDYLFISDIYDELYPQNPNFGFYDILNWLGKQKPINADVEQQPLIYKGTK
jgi:spore coat polysaccharide biosynthesis protein SpsF